MLGDLRDDMESILAEASSTHNLEETHAFWDHYSRAVTDHYKVDGFCKTVRHLALRFGNIDYLEIGSNKGLSMGLVCGLLKNAGASGAMVSVDPYFEGGYLEHGINRRIDKTTKAIATAFYLRRNLTVELIEQPSRTGLTQLIKQDRRFHLVYVDGSHNWLDPMIDFSLATCLTRECGVIMLDDLGLPEIRPVADFVATHLPLIHDSRRLRCFEWHSKRVFEEEYRQTSERLAEE